MNDSPMACRFINGLLGPDSNPAPVFGEFDTLADLARTVEEGLSVTPVESFDMQAARPSADTAIELAIGRLQEQGLIPYALDKVTSLDDDQRNIFGFESRHLDPSKAMQDYGLPPFKHLDIGQVLAALRFVARYQEIVSGKKPFFQLGIVTMRPEAADLNGRKPKLHPNFFAQTFLAEHGDDLHTVWLFRRCATDGLCHEEFWSAFVAPGKPEETRADTPMQELLQATAGTSIHSQAQTPAYVAPTTSKKRPRSNSLDESSNNPQPARKPRVNRYHNFRHHLHTDEEIFSFDPELIQGDTILRLAQKYSNGQIWERINKNHPGQVKNVNVITKRLTHAIEAAAKAQDCDVQVIRQYIANEKKRNGVQHKMKVATKQYAAVAQEEAEGEDENQNE